MLSRLSVDHFTASSESSAIFVRLIRLSVIGLILLSLTLFAASCKTVEPTIVKETVFVYPPQSLMAPTPTPEPGLRDARRNGQLLNYSKSCEASLTMCNADKRRMLELSEPPDNDRTEKLPLKPASESLFPGLMLPGKTPAAGAY